MNGTIGVEPDKLEARVEVSGKLLLAEYASLMGNPKCEFLQLTTWPQFERHAPILRSIRAKQLGKKRDQIIEVINIRPARDALLIRLENFAN